MIKHHFAYLFLDSNEARRTEYHLLDYFSDHRLSGEWVDRPFAEVRSAIIEYSERDAILRRAFDHTACAADLAYVQRVMKNQTAKEESNRQYAEAIRREAKKKAALIEAERIATAKGIPVSLVREGPPLSTKPTGAERIAPNSRKSSVEEGALPKLHS